MSNLIKNPYPGIRPFEESEADYFYGREKQITELSNRLLDENIRFLAVVGGSGSGKSSLVKAGLIPRIKKTKDQWIICTIRPANNPIERLVEGLKSTFNNDEIEDFIDAELNSSSLGLVNLFRQTRLEGNLLIIVDQFEEIFRYQKGEDKNQGKEDAIKFVKLLIRASNEKLSNIHIALTMRSEFLGDCSQFSGLPEKINDGQFLVPRLTRQQYKEAITKPVQVVDPEIRISPSLVSEILNDIQDDPDQLPVAQHALMRTFQNWIMDDKAKLSNAKIISREYYERTGGMASGISIHADEILNRLKSKHKGKSKKITEFTKYIFQSLTETNSENRGIRNPTSFELLQSIASDNAEHLMLFEEILNAYRAEGVNILMPPLKLELTASTKIDISHESIMRKWQVLKNKWLPEENLDKQILKGLAKDLEAKINGKGTYIPGPALKEITQWHKFKEYKVRAGEITSWAKRYHIDFKEIAEFISKSKQNANFKFYSTRLVLPLLAALTVIVFLYLENSRIEQEKTAAQDRLALLSEKDALAQKLKYLERENENLSKRAENFENALYESKESSMERVIETQDKNEKLSNSLYRSEDKVKALNFNLKVLQRSLDQAEKSSKACEQEKQKLREKLNSCQSRIESLEKELEGSK